MSTENKTFYLVQRHGVYAQGEVGIFDSLELAKAAVIRAKAAERDEYHSFHILEFQLNELCSYTDEGYYGNPKYIHKVVA